MRYTESTLMPTASANIRPIECVVYRSFFVMALVLRVSARIHDAMVRSIHLKNQRILGQERQFNDRQSFC